MLIDDKGMGGYLRFKVKREMVNGKNFNNIVEEQPSTTTPKTFHYEASTLSEAWSYSPRNGESKREVKSQFFDLHFNKFSRKCIYSLMTLGQELGQIDVHLFHPK